MSRNCLAKWLSDRLPNEWLWVRIPLLFVFLLVNYNYFIGYLYTGDRQTKWMYLLIEHDDLLEKYNTIWDKVSADIKKELDSEPVYNKNYLKTKIQSHGDEVTDFYDKKIPKLDFNNICLAVITLDSALKKDDNYYPEVFIKECKYIEKKVIRHSNDNFSDFSSDDESDEEWIKAIRSISFENAIFEGVILKSPIKNNFFFNT